MFVCPAYLPAFCALHPHGHPHLQDLETVAAAHARTVILLHPDKDEAAEVHKTATLLSLQSCRSHPSTTLRRQRVVLQVGSCLPACLHAALPPCRLSTPAVVAAVLLLDLAICFAHLSLHLTACRTPRCRHQSNPAQQSKPTTQSQALFSAPFLRLPTSSLWRSTVRALS